MSIRAVVGALFAMVAALALAACGDSGGDAQSLSFSFAGEGKAAKFSGPESAESGEAEITFANETKDEAELQLIRVEGDHSAEEVVEGLTDASSGKPFPDWFFAGGGVSSTKAGESKTVTQVLEPGTYYTTNVEAGPPSADALVAIEVTGDESDEQLEADATVKAVEYTFEDEGLEAGENEIAFQNDGAQPHHLFIAPIKGDATIEEVKAAIKEEKGPPPIEEKGSQTATAVVEGGESQLVDVDLKPGRYAFIASSATARAARPTPSRAWSKRSTSNSAKGRGRPAQARCSRIRSTASSMRSSGVVREILKKPSPLGPYIEPGETITAASSSTSSANEVEVWPSGTGAQT